MWRCWFLHAWSRWSDAKSGSNGVYQLRSCSRCNRVASRWLYD